MVPIISLDVLPADVPAHDAPAMVEACSSALAAGSCALAAELPESTSPAAVALVLWQGADLTQVTVRVGRGGEQWLVRALNFSEQDSIVERWTTVGLTVATLAGEAGAIEAGTEPPLDAAPIPVRAAPETRAVDAPAPRAPSSTPQESRHLLGSLGALAGPGWDGGEWQRGAWVAVTYRMHRSPLQAHVFGSYAASQGPTLQQLTVRTRWLTAGLGAGLYVDLPDWNVLGSAALEVAYRHISAELNGGSLTDQELPLRLRAAAAYPARGVVGATLGALLRLPPSNSGRSKGSWVRAAPVALELLAGVEVRL